MSIEELEAGLDRLIKASGSNPYNPQVEQYRETVYSVCFHTGPGIDEWEKRTRYFLTKQAADLHVPGINYFVNAHALNLFEMRELIRSLEHVAPEELEVFKELKSTIFS